MLSEQDREYIEQAAKLAAQEAIELSVPRMKHVAKEQIQTHRIECPGAKALVVWKVVAVVGAFVAGIAGVAGAVLAVVKH